MTRRPDLDERDPQPATPWQPTSREWRRKDALRLTAEAIKRAKERRGAPYGQAS